MSEIINLSAIAEGHPVQIYFQERELIERLLGELSATNPAEEIQKYINIFNQLETIEKRFARKENQLFPFLEKKGWNQTHNVWVRTDAIKAYHVEAIPTTYIIDRQGRIVAANPASIPEIVNSQLHQERPAETR